MSRWLDWWESGFWVGRFSLFFDFFKKSDRLRAVSESGGAFGAAPNYSFVNGFGGFVERWKFFEANMDAGACFRNCPVANFVRDDLVHA